eukprot:gene2200-2374_t
MNLDEDKQYFVNGAIRGTPEGFSSVSFQSYSNNKKLTYVYWNSTKGITKNEDFGHLKFEIVNNFKEVYFSRGSWDLLFFSFQVNESVYNNSDFINISSNVDKSLLFNNQENSWNMQIDSYVEIPFKEAKTCEVFLCNLRISQMHFVYMMIDQTIVLALICIGILLRNSQPLKSRGFILIFGLIIQFFEGFQNLIPYFMTVEESYKYEYILQDVIFVTLRFSSYLLIILNMLRIFLVLFIQRNYHFIYSNTSVSSSIIGFIAYLKFFTSDFGSLIGSLLLFFSQGVFSFIFILIVSHLYHAPLLMNDLLFQFFQVKLILFKSFFIFIIICLTILDIILNLRDFICNFKKFFSSDPFAFRLQQIWIIPIIVVEILEMSWFWNGKRCLDNTIWSIVYSTLYRVFTIFYFSGFVMILTALKKFIELFQQKVELDNDTIDEIFKDEEKFEIFKEYVKKEFSNENVLLYQDIKKYQIEEDFATRKILANHIYMKYLNGNLSELEANISGKFCREVYRKIKNEQFEPDLFDSCLLTIKENLADTYSRFILSERYTGYESSVQLLKDHIQSSSELSNLLPKFQTSTSVDSPLTFYASKAQIVEDVADLDLD